LGTRLWRYPPEPSDHVFGRVLHPADLAANKLLAAADRFGVRDSVWADQGLVIHHGSRKAAWPSSPEIGSVMLRERRGG
jgi:hypothetical protein